MLLCISRVNPVSKQRRQQPHRAATLLQLRVGDRGHPVPSRQKALKTLDYQSLSRDDCRGQSYDNAATMPGEHSGLQTKSRQISPLARPRCCQ